MSSGTNSERILRNNNLLATVKTQIDNLPESTINNQDKTITQNGQYTADSGYTGLGTVTVNVPSGSGDVKLFETEQAMQADPNPSEGDLAVVYGEEIQPVTEESEFDSCTFPNTVVLDNAFSGDIYGEFRAVDHSVMFNGDVDMSSSKFRFNGWGKSSQVRVEYTSQDGITYTRTDGGEELVEFGTTIKYEPMEPWNDVFGNFMKIGGNYFGGLYQYANKINEDYYNIMTAMHVNSEELKVTTENENTYIPSLKNTISNITDSKYKIVTRENNEYYVYTIGSQGFSYASENKIYWIDIWADSGGTITDEHKFSKYKLDLENSTCILISEEKDMFLCNWVDGSFWNRNYYGVIFDLSELDIIAIFDNNSVSDYGIRTLYEYTGEYMTGNNIDLDVTDMLYNHTPFKAYHYASTQLNATADDVYEKTFYGKNGVEVGTLQNKENLTKNMVKHRVNIWSNYNSGIICPSDTSDMFSDCKSLTTIPLLDTSNVTKMTGMFDNCTSLTAIPLLDTSNVTKMADMFRSCSNLTTIPLLDTSNVTKMTDMFDNCKNLTTVPNFNTSNVTDMQYMFNSCKNLTTVPNFNTSNVTNMHSMFHGCTSLTTVPNFNTSNVTNMHSMFHGCTSLTTIPLLDTSNVTNMYGTFDGCTSLSDESLNNILAMCKNAVKITSNKTLMYIGLTEEQAQICTTLSNYQAFVNAGWTTGY